MLPNEHKVALTDARAPQLPQNERAGVPLMIGLVARVVALINLFPYGEIVPGETLTVTGLEQNAILMRLDTLHPLLPPDWENTLWIDPTLTTWVDCLIWPNGNTLETVYSKLQNPRRRAIGHAGRKLKQSSISA